MGRERRQNNTPTACKHTGACQCKFGLRENAYFWLSLILVFVPNPFRRHLIWRTTWGLLALGHIRPNPSWVWQRNCTFSHHICKSLASFGTFVLPCLTDCTRILAPVFPAFLPSLHHGSMAVASKKRLLAWNGYMYNPRGLRVHKHSKGWPRETCPTNLLSAVRHILRTSAAERLAAARPTHCC